MRSMIKALPLILAVSLALLAPPALAEPTHVMVRAQAQDAKFIGDHVGGFRSPSPTREPARCWRRG